MFDGRFQAAYVSMQKFTLVGLMAGTGLIGALGYSSAANAALGGDANSIVTDRLAMAADSTSTVVTRSSKTAASTAGATADTMTGATTGAAASTATYTVQTMVTTAGTTINEYVSASGSVFAISWNGPFIPDLRQLLGGQHFSTYSGALAARAASGAIGPLRGPARVENDNLVVHSSGRMRAFQGIAYLKNLLPDGFNTADIQ